MTHMAQGCALANPISIPRQIRQEITKTGRAPPSTALPGYLRALAAAGLINGITTHTNKKPKIRPKTNKTLEV
jgi:hypothetical protein